MVLKYKVGQSHVTHPQCMGFARDHHHYILINSNERCGHLQEIIKQCDTKYYYKILQS